MVHLALQRTVRSMLHEFPGHCFIKTSKSIRGFYPASKPKAPFWFTGKVVDDSKTSYNVQNTYTYRACPESVRELEENMNKSEKNPPTYNLGNLGGFNCCGLACSMMDSAGFIAPFPAKTPGLAPAPYYGQEYAPNRRPNKIEYEDLLTNIVGVSYGHSCIFASHTSFISRC